MASSQKMADQQVMQHIWQSPSSFCAQLHEDPAWASRIVPLIIQDSAHDIREKLKLLSSILLGLKPQECLRQLKAESDKRSTLCGYVWREVCECIKVFTCNEIAIEYLPCQGVCAYRCKTCEVTRARYICFLNQICLFIFYASYWY